jgi:hypothetical protein
MGEYRREEDVMKAGTLERGRVTALNDEDPNLVWFAEQCQNNHVRIDALIRSAERARDPDMAAFFRRAESLIHRLSGVPHATQGA